MAKKKHAAEGVWRRHDGEVRLLGFDQPHISVRDWRRKPPLRLRSTKKLDICWCWIKCTRCPNMAAAAIAPYLIRWGPEGWQDMLREAARCSGCGAAAELGAPLPANGSPEQLIG